MADDDGCWDAFGPDSDSDSDSDGENDADADGAAAGDETHDMGRDRQDSKASRPSTSNEDDDGQDEQRVLRRLVSESVDRAALHVTRAFLSEDGGGGMFGTALSDRYFSLPTPVGTENGDKGSVEDKWRELTKERLGGRGVQVVAPAAEGGGEDPCCDAAAFFVDCRGEEGGREMQRKRQGISAMKRNLVPGGFVCVFFALNGDDDADPTKGLVTENLLSRKWDGMTPFQPSVWDVEGSSFVHLSGASSENRGHVRVAVVAVTKRPCPVDASSCPWKDLHRKVPSHMAAGPHGRGEETWLQHERRIAGLATVPRTASERRTGNMVSEASIRRAAQALRDYGFVVVRDLFDPAMTSRWGEAVLSDFQAAADILKERDGVDVANPSEGHHDPVSYREMAMREDLRVDLRDGPEMAKLRGTSNGRDARELGLAAAEVSEGPTITTKDGIGDSVRFHPAVLEIVRRVFNPHSADEHGTVNEDTITAAVANTNYGGTSPALPLYRGNFGRYNFSGSGPDGSPQPLRVGQVGSVVSLPGSADQAVHADAPHLFEHVDCLPCHYANLFTPGADVVKHGAGAGESNSAFDEDGNCTGASAAGGTALVYGSHRLSVTARLTAAEEDDRGDGPIVVDTTAGGGTTTVVSAAATLRARDEMHLRTLRPSLRPGDALIFDTRALHFGLANRSGGAGGEGVRRPVLYVNLTHAWFHDPKNWDDREGIFPSS